MLDNLTAEIGPTISSVAYRRYYYHTVATSDMDQNAINASKWAKGLEMSNRRLKERKS